jgi:hypothetical protein
LSTKCSTIAVYSTATDFKADFAALLASDVQYTVADQNASNPWSLTNKEENMNEKPHRGRVAQPQRAETSILSLIVNAMLAAQTDLQDATVEQWSHALADSCRRHRQWLDDLRLAASSTC